MKKITNKKLQTVLLRGAVLVSGGLATAIISLFIDNIYGVVVTMFLGAGMIAFIDETITDNLNNKHYETEQN